MHRTTFEELGLIEPLLASLRHEGYKKPTPIQQGAIHDILKGRDLIGIAQTGTGKTAAFALPTLQNLSYGDRTNRRRVPRALVLAPTRELAIQVDRSFAAYGRSLGLRGCVIFGGVGQQPQANAIGRGVDLLVATPGRLLDLMGQRIVDLSHIEIFILDEADRMLDMGFIHDVKKVVKAIPHRRQTLLFSATMPPAVKDLAGGLLKDPATVSVNPNAPTVDRIDQKVMFVAKKEKKSLLLEILKDASIYRVLVFTRTKHRANRVADRLHRNKIQAEAMHGNKSQGARQRALKGFVRGDVRVLVATDIAARGIDIDEISHVINFELPNEPEGYVHRIGRTARAGADGIAISFCEAEERHLLSSIERVIKKRIPVDRDHPYHSNEAENAPAKGGRSNRRGEFATGRDEHRNSRGPGHRGDKPRGKRTAGGGQAPVGGRHGRSGRRVGGRANSGGYRRK